MTAGTKAIDALLYIETDPNKLDQDRLRQWYLVCIGKSPQMETAIGEEAKQLLLQQIASDLAIIDQVQAEKDLTRF